jgi:hypothetical protein
MKFAKMILGVAILTFTSTQAMAYIFAPDAKTVGCYGVGKDLKDSRNPPFDVVPAGQFIGLIITKDTGGKYNAYVQDAVVLGNKNGLAYMRLLHEVNDLKRYTRPDGFIFAGNEILITITSSHKSISGLIQGQFYDDVPLVESLVYCGM